VCNLLCMRLILVICFVFFILMGLICFFVFLYLHMLKGLFYCSYRLSIVWIRGVTIFILVMLTAFLGYVLVWGQIRFWAAVVITNLVSVIPYVGVTLIFWIWAGFSVNNGTLGLFFYTSFSCTFYYFNINIASFSIFAW